MASAKPLDSLSVQSVHSVETPLAPALTSPFSGVANKKKFGDLSSSDSFGLMSSSCAGTYSPQTAVTASPMSAEQPLPAQDSIETGQHGTADIKLLHN